MSLQRRSSASLSRVSRLLLAAVLSGALTSTALAAAAPTGAAATTWTSHRTGEASLFGMSCPSESLCVGVGSSNTVVTSTAPDRGQWETTQVGAGELGGGYHTVSRQIRGVSCPTAGFCVAVSLEGLVYTSTDPAGGASAWTATDLDPVGPNDHIYGISCPATNLCVAAAAKGRILTSTDPTGGAGAWTPTQLPEPIELRGISCPSAGLCVAVGTEGEILSSTAPLAGPSAWHGTQLGGEPVDRTLLGVGCGGAGLCVTGNTDNTIYVSQSPTGSASTRAPSQGGSNVQITDVDCPSEAKCVAVDNNGDVLTSTDPTGGLGAWTFENLLPYASPLEEANVLANAFFGVSCASPSLCAIGGAKGQIFTSSEPFASPLVAPPEAPSKKMGAKKHHGPRHPRAIIAAFPPAEIPVAHGKAKVRFRFFAANHASVRGFVCNLDGRPLKRCRSPKSYRAGVGVHHFSVRAVGWAGSKGKRATARFEVCRPTDVGLCVGPPLSRSEAR